jgi:hypothetical protein
VRWADISDPFLGKGSVNTFPRQRLRMQQSKYCWKRGVCVWSVLRCYKQGTKLELSPVAGYSPDSNDVSIEAEESTLLISVTRKRLVKTN